MNDIYSLGKVYVAKSRIRGAGRGVFSSKKIKKGEEVETCPLIQITNFNLLASTNNTLLSYIFFYGKNNKKAALLLGFGSLYNHSDEPNIYHKLKSDSKAVEFIALNNIKKDTELTFNYRGEKTKKELPLWFE